MTINSLNKEHLEKIIAAADEVITALTGEGDIHPEDSGRMVEAYDWLNDRMAPPAVVKAMAATLLAGNEQKPVAWRYRFVHTPTSLEHGSYFTTDWVMTESEDDCNPSDCFERQPLYTYPAPSIPIIPPKTMPDEVYDILIRACGDNACLFADELWNAFLAAMPQSDSTSVPHDQK